MHHCRTERLHSSVVCLTQEHSTVKAEWRTKLCTHYCVKWMAEGSRSWCHSAATVAPLTYIKRLLRCAGPDILLLFVFIEPKYWRAIKWRSESSGKTHDTKTKSINLECSSVHLAEVHSTYCGFGSLSLNVIVEVTWCQKVQVGNNVSNGNILMKTWLKIWLDVEKKGISLYILYTLSQNLV